MAVSPPVRIPLSWDYNSRSIGAPGNNIDSRRLNVFDEPKVGQDGVYTKPRPAFTASATFGGTGLGQGLTTYQGQQFAVIADNLVSIGPPNSGASGTAWTANANAAWLGRTQGGCVVLGDSMFVIAGNLNSTTASDVWSTRDGVHWTLVTGSAPFGNRAQFGCVVLNGLIYVLGGLNTITSASQNDVWSSPDGATWTLVTAAAPWAVRFSHGCMTIANGIYLAGGYGAGGTTDLQDSWYSTDGKNWSQVALTNPWSARGSFSIVNLMGQAFLYGGATHAGVCVNDCWGSPDGGVTWVIKNAGPFASARQGIGTIVYQNKMWAIGGMDNALTQLASIYNSIDGVTWNLITAAPGFTAGFAPYCAAFNTPTSVSSGHYRTMWVMGGHIAGAALNTVNRANLNVAISTGISLAPAVANQQYQFASFREGSLLLIKNQSNLWVYDDGVVTVVTDPSYPNETVPGLVVLGAYAYVMDPTGLIRNCLIDDPYHWPSLNAIAADYDDDPGVCLAKYMNFAVAFGTFTTQFFYDAGRSPGSPLLPYANANMKVGCYDALTVVEMGNTIIWLSNSKQSRRQVVYLNGMTPEPISTPFIEDILYSGNVVGSYGIAFNRHQFYVITIANGSPSWTYDFLTKQWYEWSLGASSNAYLVGTAMGQGTGGTTPFLLNGPTGQLIQLVATGGADYNGTPPIICITPKMDLGNNRIKFWGQLEVIGDHSASLPTIQYSDDDYQTWSTARSVDMSQPRPILYRNGASRRRAFRLNLQDGLLNRFDGLEITLEQGN